MEYESIKGSKRVWKEPMYVPSTMSAQPSRVVTRGPTFLLSRAPMGKPVQSAISANGITCTASGVTPPWARPSKKRMLVGA